MRKNLGAATRHLPLTALYIMIFLLAPCYLAAQGLKSQVKSLKKVLIESGIGNISEAPPVKRFLAYLDTLVDLNSEIAALDTSISASGGFDNGRYSSGAVDVQAKIDRASYPHALRFKASSKFIFSPGSVQNELTSILINYDYNLSKNVEAYGFIQRFSDTLMSIKQRYESGVGIKLEFDVDPPGGFKNTLYSSITPPSENDENRTWNIREIRKLNKYSDLREAFVSYIENITPPIDKDKEEICEAIYQVVSFLDREHRNIQAAILKKRTPFSWGIAFSILSEVEQPEINTGTPDPTTGKNILVPAEVAQLFRLAMRPSFIWRPSDVISLTSQVYWKPSLQRTPTFFKDSRLDIHSSMSFKVAKDFLWGGPASFSADYEYHYDWMPPQLSDTVVNDYLTRGIVLAYIRGAKFHHYFAIRFDVSF